jgi:circadian clock protein KaiC
LKKRTGNHERSIREFRLASDGIWVGPVLDQFQGVLTGVPTFVGATALLSKSA